jgi:PncC family amidohydrolase
VSAIDDVAARVAALVADRSVACAESCTGGLLVQALAAQEGSGDWLRGGLVAYQTSVKRRLLSVEAEDVVTEQAAREMARGAAGLFDADIAIATTGVAGPDAVDGIAPGTVIISWAVGDDLSCGTFHLRGDPEDVCHAAVDVALRGLHDSLASPPAGSG